MTRIKILAALVAIACLSLSVAAYQQAGRGQAQARVVDVDKLRDNLYVLRGGGGNTAIFIAANGVVVVDINTHTHGDHVSGNVEFPATVEVIVHENTKANMMEMRGATGIPQQGPPTNIFKEHNGIGLPKRTFKDKMSIGTGNDRIDLFYFGRGHTNGDAWVLFPALRVVHAGDIFAGKNLPLLDANNGGSGVQIGDSLAKAANSLKNVETIITGHSMTTMSMADLREYAEFNKEFLAVVREAKKAGKSVDDVAKTWKMPAKYTGYGAPQEARLKANIQVIYDELK